MRAYIGDFGHLMLIVAFVSCLISTGTYYLASVKEDKSWLHYARGAFYLHSVSVILAFASLFVIIYNHYYEYHYAWSHSSNFLPVHYMISCFWEGQEGSFLLWVFWHVLIGVLLIRFHKDWEPSVMTIFTGVQVFLVSMLLGVVMFDYKLGSSPFIMLRDAMPDAPIFQVNKDFIPEDGTGLNPLLQNYWMVIHPPTLFLGFAGSLVPFAFCVAGLWKNKFTEWIKPAFPWMSATALVLGVGILMGAYWAYETLNFGGYWNWDPVENAVYVPWLVMVAAIHTMLIYRKNGTALKLSVILVSMSFLLILYSTFLTRSGVLGDSSVHSFTDLGLSGQLLIYLLAFVILFAVVAALRWKNLNIGEKEATVYTKEFWLFIGVGVILIAGFQIIMATSIPVFNEIKGLFGERGKMAPPSDQALFYSRFQIWPTALFTLFGAIAQFIWWKGLNKESAGEQVSKYFTWLGISLLIAMLCVGYYDYSSGELEKVLQNYQGSQSLMVLIKHLVHVVSYVFLVGFSLALIFISGTLLKAISKQNKKLVGGTVAHVGLGVMLIGILFSSAYSKVVSINQSGLLYSKQFSDEMNLQNILLWRGQELNMDKYKLTYIGPKVETKDEGILVDKEVLSIDKDNHLAIFKHNFTLPSGEKVKTGDSVTVYPENTYYKVVYEDESKDQFILYPRAQVNPSMGLLASPDVKHLLHKDLYSFVASIPDPQEDTRWSDTETMQIKLGDTLFLNDFAAVLDSVKQLKNTGDLNLKEGDIAIRAFIRVLLSDDKFDFLMPVMKINLQVGEAFSTTEINNAIGVKISFVNIDPKTDGFTFAVNTTQRDYVILNVMEKPLINLLWIGALIVAFGFGVSVYRRVKEY